MSGNSDFYPSFFWCRCFCSCDFTFTVAILFEASHEEGLLMINIVRDMSKAPLLEASTSSSSSDASSGGAASDVPIGVS
jgi:hypothetical protein